MKTIIGFISILIFGCAIDQNVQNENFAVHTVEQRAALNVCLNDGIPVESLVGSCGEGISAIPPLISGETYVALRDTLRQGFAGYLYDGTNTIPARHKRVGDSLGALVRPINNKIRVVAEGMSNAKLIFGGLQLLLSSSSLDNPKVEFINQAQGGCDLDCWIAGGVGTIDKNVQVVLAYHSMNRPQAECEKYFPTHAQSLQAKLEQRLAQLRIKYPRAKQFFFGVREFGGWSNLPSGTGLREPVGFEEGFAVKWLVNSYLGRMPFVGFGPYTWTPATPRSYFQEDGTHPCNIGQMFFAQQWFDFLLNDSTSKGWFAKQ